MFAALATLTVAVPSRKRTDGLDQRSGGRELADLVLRVHRDEDHGVPPAAQEVLVESTRDPWSPQTWPGRWSCRTAMAQA